MNSLKKAIEVAGTFTYPDHARVKAIEELSEYPEEEVFTVITKCAIVDNSPQVRRKAVQVLQGISPQAAHETFLKHLQHTNPRVLERAIQALRQLTFDPRRTVHALLGVVKHQDPRVRVAAREAVAKLTENGNGLRGPSAVKKTALHVVGQRAAYV